MAVNKKTCTKCGEEKILGEFYACKKHEDGRTSWCKKCQSEYRKKRYREVTRETELANSAKWHKVNPEKIKESNRKAYAAHGVRYRGEGRFRKSLVSARYNARKGGYVPCIATAEEIEAEFTGYCHACGMNEGDNSMRLDMDHDHLTGRFRGWLCKKCNVTDVLANKRNTA